MVLDSSEAEGLAQHWIQSTTARLRAGRYTAITDEAARILAGLKPRGKVTAPYLEKRDSNDLAYLNWMYRGGVPQHRSAFRKWYEKNTLDLSGLTTLSETAANEFSEKKLGTLMLDGLRDITDAVAASLSKYRGPLSLNGLITLSDAAAISFGKHWDGPSRKIGWNHLSLRKVRVISAKGFAALGSSIASDPGKVFTSMKWEELAPDDSD